MGFWNPYFFEFKRLARIDLSGQRGGVDASVRRQAGQVWNVADEHQRVSRLNLAE